MSPIEIEEKLKGFEDGTTLDCLPDEYRAETTMQGKMERVTVNGFYRSRLASRENFRIHWEGRQRMKDNYDEGCPADLPCS